MAITAGRYTTLLLLFIAATISYAAGFIGGFILFIAIGAILESIFWFKLIFRRRNR